MNNLHSLGFIFGKVFRVFSISEAPSRIPDKKGMFNINIFTIEENGFASVARAQVCVFVCVRKCAWA